MEKGKVQKGKKYLSIILVPHSSGDIKVMKFSALYLKFAVAAIMAAIGLAALIICLIGAINENSRLKSRLYELSNLNAEQNNLIKEKADEIKQLKQREDDINAKIKEFTDKYNEMIDNYIGNKSGNIKTSRSGESNVRSFVKDHNELKLALDNLEEAFSSKGSIYESLQDTEAKLEQYVESIPTFWPTSGKVSSGFGGRHDPIRHFNRAFHTGIDIAAEYGAEIRASASGKVILAKRIGVYGNTVIIDHGHGITTMYGHTSKILVKLDQQVKKGQLIARVGSSGRSTGSHLHFEVRVDDVPVDPLKYLDRK